VTDNFYNSLLEIFDGQESLKLKQEFAEARFPWYCVGADFKERDNYESTHDNNDDKLGGTTCLRFVDSSTQVMMTAHVAWFLLHGTLCDCVFVRST